MSEQKIPEFKLVLAGDGGIGKTSLVRRLTQGNYEKKYIATLGVEVQSLVLTTNTNIGKVKLNLWDTAGQEKLSGLREGYYIAADCAIVMFDVTSIITFKDIAMWITGLRRVCNNIPIVVVGNKVDSIERKLTADNIFMHMERKKIPYFHISVRANYQIFHPFLYHLRVLKGMPILGLLESPYLLPSFEMNPQQI